uniref:Uncharacterized protein n=1 Tax=Anguilla anguilla TaxID=7936 RepID=A0A0E9P6S6_ANGAN
MPTSYIDHMKGLHETHWRTPFINKLNRDLLHKPGHLSKVLLKSEYFK